MTLYRALIASYGPGKVYASLGALLVLVVIVALIVFGPKNGDTDQGDTDQGDTGQGDTGQGDTSTTVTVPSLIGANVDDATDDYESDFDIVIERQTADEPEGEIIEQDPEPSARVERDSNISVVVSDGPEQTTVAEGEVCPDDYFVFTRSEALSMCVSPSWTELDERSWTTDGQDGGYTLSASPDLEEFAASYDVPGVVFSATDSQQILDKNYNEILTLTSIDYASDCEDGGPAVEYTTADEVYTGVYKEWLDCDGSNTIVRVYALTPREAADVLALLEVQLVTSDDETTEELILDTFDVVSEDL